MNSSHVVRANTWAISDGAAGNRRQADALAAALDHDFVPVHLSARAPWRWLAPRGLPLASRAFGRAFREQIRAQAPRLAIGCGRQAALATRLLRGRGEPPCRSVQILNPRRPLQHWDAVIAPAHDGLRGSNVIQTLGSLNPVDDAWLARSRAQFPALGELPSPRIALLMGGPISAVPWNDPGWRALLSILDAWLRDEGGSLLIAGSRRTPVGFAALLRARFAQAPGLRWFQAGDGANPYAGVLAWGERFVVSADSVNLTSEACATGRPVLPVFTAKPGSRHARFHQALRETGRTAELRADVRASRYEPMREALYVAGELVRRGLVGRGLRG